MFHGTQVVENTIIMENHGELQPEDKADLGSSDNNSVIASVICECRDRLLEELCSESVTQALYTNGFISTEDHKAIRRERNQVGKITKLLTSLEESRNDDALDHLIQHLRDEGTQPHLWTMLEYSRAKHRRIRASVTPISVTLHM